MERSATVEVIFNSQDVLMAFRIEHSLVPLLPSSELADVDVRMYWQ